MKMFSSLLMAGALVASLASTAHADAAGLLCSAQYVPGNDAAGAIFGKQGSISYLVAWPSCSASNQTWSQTFYLCSNGATSPTCGSNYNETQLLSIASSLAQAAMTGSLVYTTTDTVTYTKARFVRFEGKP